MEIISFEFPSNPSIVLSIRSLRRSLGIPEVCKLSEPFQKQQVRIYNSLEQVPDIAFNVTDSPLVFVT